MHGLGCGEYSALREQNVADQLERYASEFVLKLLKKRLFSSPAAFARTLARHEQSLAASRRHGTQATQRPGLGILRQQVERVDEEYADDNAYEDSTDDAVDATTRLFRALTPAELGLMRQMKEWAEGASARPDSKTLKLIKWLEDEIRPNGEWSDQRVIIFTEYRATQNWLQTILASRGFTAEGRLMTLYGGMDDELREQVKAAFQAAPDVSPVRILLATDAASEGIDLQNHCHRLIILRSRGTRTRWSNAMAGWTGMDSHTMWLIYHFWAEGLQAGHPLAGDRR